MASVKTHYDHHLGPVYSWMMGGFDSAIERGASELESIDAKPKTTGLAVDLGAGFGMHAIPLANRGFRVLAIDNCKALVDELRHKKGQLPIDIIKDDLICFSSQLTESPDIVLCMNDTLVHLEDKASITKLVQSVAGRLAPGGQFIATFRDYSTPLVAEKRFIPVRSSSTRIFSCFLEYTDTHLTVNDILHQWDGTQWASSISSYKKLRLSPDWLIHTLRSAGFKARSELNEAGMVRVIANRL